MCAWCVAWSSIRAHRFCGSPISRNGSRSTWWCRLAHGIPGKTDMGDIYASVSTNDGDTWSEPACIFDHRQRYGSMQFGYANPALFKPPGQDVLWCFAMRCPMNYQHSEDSQLVAAFSGDGGRSWRRRGGTRDALHGATDHRDGRAACHHGKWTASLPDGSAPQHEAKRSSGNT